jgi:hypothetical protein
MLFVPIKGESLNNTILTAGTDGIRNQLYLFSGKRGCSCVKNIKKDMKNARIW